MAQEKVRIKYEIDKKELDEANEALEKLISENEELQKEVDNTNEKFEDQEKELSKLNKSFNGIGGQLKGVANRFSIAGKGVGDLASGMFNATKATSATSKAMKVLKVALASTGIGLIIVALGTLTTFLTKTQRGSNILSKAMAGLGAATDVLVDRFSAAGEVIFNAFNDPKQAIIDFSESIKQFVLNRVSDVINGFTGLGRSVKLVFEGEFQKAIDTGKEALIDLATGAVPVFGIIKDNKGLISDIAKEISEEASAASALEERLQALELREISLIVTREKARAEVKALNKVAEDTSKSLQERQAAAAKAIDTENKLQKERIDIAKERADIIKEQVDLGESLNEDFRKQAEAEAELFRIRQESDELLTTLQNKNNILINQIEKQTDATEKQTDAEGTRTLEKIRQEALITAEIQASQLERQGDLVRAEEVRRAAILDNEELTAQERELIIEESEQRIEEIRAGFRERQKEAAASTAKSIFDTLLLFQDFRIAKLKEEEAFELKLAGDNAERKAQIEDKFAKKVAKEREKSAKISKASSLFEAGINTAQGVTAALSLGALGIVLAPIIGALGAAQIGLIAATPIPKFEKGGKIGGNLHSQGGTIIEAERNEHVINRRATSKYGHDLFDRINRLELSPNILNGSSGGASLNVIDTTPIAEAINNRPENHISIDQNGFTQLIIKKDYEMKQKISRYKS